MESINNTTLNEDALNKLLNSSTQNLIPESVQTLLLVSFIVLNAATVVFVIAYIFSVVRKWKVQSAILKIHTDVTDIKQSLKTLADVKTPIEPVITHVPVSPVSAAPKRDIVALPSEKPQTSENS